MEANSKDSILLILQRNKIELACITVSTVFYYFYQYLKNSQKQIQYQGIKPTQKFTKYQLEKKIPLSILNSQNSLLDEIKHLYNPSCRIQIISHLIKELNLKNIPSIKSPLIGDNQFRNIYGGGGFLPEQAFIYRGSFVLSKNVYSNFEDFVNPTQWLLAGPRKYLHFKPASVKAAIVTCGGLCPGLNVVIREIYTTLTILYGCSEVWGINFGYMGFYSGQSYWHKLTMQDIRTVQYQGGTFLGSSRGGFDQEKIIDAVCSHGINQLYIIGGDGTHRAILKLHDQIKKRKLQISIVGVPKTIDNDIPIIDKSFGFETAVSESIRAIRSAYVESVGVNYGIGLVKLMGRDAGFIAMQATNASRDVNLCLIPQIPFDLYGKYGVLEYIFSELKIKKHLVVVVAEGAGSGVKDLSELKEGLAKDKSGNIKPPDIGEFLKKQIVNYCQKRGLQSTLKYIDPAYMIRTVPANSYDKKICAHLASSAVHGAMAGYTAFTVGHINLTSAMIPITALKQPNRIEQNNRSWQRMLACTGQPSFCNDVLNSVVSINKL